MSTTTTNMGLIVPTVGLEVGPDWATELNSDLGILDQHDHSNGQGVQITPAGLNINSDLPLGGNDLTMVNTVNFENLSGTLTGVAPNLGCIYVAGGELIYNDESGNVVAITSHGSVNAGAGSITGLPSGTASVSFGSSKYVFQSATATPATIDVGSVIVRNTIASGKGVTLSPVNSLGADYSLVLPQIPGATNFLTIDNSGNIAGNVAIANGIVTAMIADQNVTQAKLQAMATGTSVAAGGIASVAVAGSSATNFTSSGLTIVTTGRPVLIMLQGDGGISSYVGGTNGNGTSFPVTGRVEFQRGGTSFAYLAYDGAADNNNSFAIPASSFQTIDFVAAGTYVYTAKFQNIAASNITAVNCKLVVYEI